MHMPDLLPLPLSVALLLPMAPAMAAIDDYRVVSWNMQGASAPTESKWRVHIRLLLDGQDAANIVALQEAGSPPASAGLIRRIATTTGQHVDEYCWNLGTRSRPREVFIYFLATDVGAHRVNLAIVADRIADEVIVLPAVRPYPARPVLGIRLGHDHFFTTHALRLRSGDNDAGALSNAVDSYFRPQARPQEEWMLLADFNMPPDDLRGQLQDLFPRTLRDTRIVTQPAATQVCGNVLDYALIGRFGGWDRRVPTANLFIAQLRGQLASDHLPVLFSRPR
ncbi:cytolethal distending toxin subunit B family protein [Paludibacterium yongneupense]|uniref:cytolethal distending toxin subunit B family protein n=1 Tax=Paludibacterium yongneupense TaxID=400061 RepID=UPI000403D015|nr:cytolethal distending toxin subunit B family protein [Paludibacterium yongneupense]